MYLGCGGSSNSRKLDELRSSLFSDIVTPRKFTFIKISKKNSISMTPYQKNKARKKSQGPTIQPKEMQIQLQTMGILLQMDNRFLCFLLILVQQVLIFVIYHSGKCGRNFLPNIRFPFLLSNKLLILICDEWSKITWCKDYISQLPLHRSQAVRFRPMEWKQNCDFQEKVPERNRLGACVWILAFLFPAGDKNFLNWAPWPWK